MFPMPNAEIVVRMAKMTAEPFLFHSSLEDIHRTSGHSPPFGFDAVFHRENCFRIFCGDTEDALQSHPEHRARATGSDCCGDADDIAGADGGCQRSR